MFDIIRKHAVDTVWCSPDQDNQIMLAAARISRRGGDFVSSLVMGRVTKLPRNDKYYHLYKIGQANPVLFGLIPNTPEWMSGQWRRFSDAVNSLPLFCDLYTDQGVHIPLHQSYYMYTEDRALVFCVEINSALPIDFVNDTVYLRVYSNAYYQAVESQAVSGNTRMAGATLLSSGDLVYYQSLVTAWRAQNAVVFCYVNGHLKDNIGPLTAKIGDVIEIIQDFSVKRVVDMQISELHSFESQVDHCFKYLLHYPETTDQIIDYVDDIDVYVLDRTTNTLTGRYIHKNLAKTFRMVTYRDYSLSVDVTRNVAEGLMHFLTEQALDIRSFYVRLYIRNSGFSRPLVFDNDRQFELYKLPEDKVKQALTGVHSTLPFWDAAALEASAFIKLMSAPYSTIDIDLVEKAFGYNAISKVLGDSPIIGTDYGQFKSFRLPAAMIENSTLFEYDSEGLLLGYHYNTFGEAYISQDPNCVMVEAVSGYGTDTPSVVYGVNQIPIPRNRNYRVYKCYLNNEGFPNGEWVDVSDTDDYKVENQMLVWLTDEQDYILMVRSDDKFLCYSFDLLPVAGTLYFNLAETSGGLYRNMPVPGGDLDIWLNQKSLIHKLDYFVDFPKVYIVNKEYLKQPAGSTPQKITVRFTGFAETVDGKLRPREIEDFGYVEHGVLSNNTRYDIRDDKVLRITLKGKLKHRNDVIFSEEHEGVSIVNAINGQPYQVKEVIVPIKDMAYQNTYALRQQALVIDKAVAGYMTDKLPQPTRTPLSAMMARHLLVSPFFSHLINDLVSGQFDMEQIRVELTDDLVMAICKPYEFLLAYDPIGISNGVDQRFVLVHPHQLENTIPLDIYSYTFINRVAKLYGRGLVTLAQHLTLIGS